MRTLRTGLSQPPGSDLAPLLPLARQALAFIDRGAADDPATAGEASELAFLLASLLEAGDDAFRRQAFGLFFRLGVEGEVLAVIHLEKMPEDQALSILGGLSDEEKLLFVNAFFRRPRPDRPKTAAFGLAVLDEVVERNPDELLILLDLLANRHEYPALPLRNALVRGRLGMWLRRLLQMDLSAEQTRYMARVVGRLREPSLAEKLANRLGEVDELSAEAVCRALAETPGLSADVAALPLEALLGGAEPSLAGAALAALARCDESRAADAAANLFASRPERIPELASILAAFSLTAFGRCLRSLDPENRKAAVRAVYAFWATALPQRLQTAVQTVSAAGSFPPKTVAALEADLARRAKAALRPYPVPPPLPPDVGTSPEGDKGLWKRVRSLVAVPTGTSAGDAKADTLRRDLAQGGELRGRQILWVSLEGESVQNIALAHCNLKAVNLAQAVLSQVTFTDCQFSDVSFEQSRLSHTTFAGCRFSNCRFSRAGLDTVRFTDCELRLCVFEEAIGREVAFSDVEPRNATFSRSASPGCASAEAACGP